MREEEIQQKIDTTKPSIWKNKDIGSLSAADTSQPLFTDTQLQGPYNATPEPEDLAGTVQPEPWDLEQIFDRVILFAEKLSKRFKKPKKVVEEAPQPPTVKPGGEIAQELTDAWNLYTRVCKKRIFHPG